MTDLELEEFADSIERKKGTINDLVEFDLFIFEEEPNNTFSFIGIFDNLVFYEDFRGRELSRPMVSGTKIYMI